MKNFLKVVSRRFYNAKVPSFSGGINVFSDSRTLPLSRGESSYNFDYSSGALGTGWGICDSGIAGAVSVWNYVRTGANNVVEDILMYANTSGNVYYFREGKYSQLAGVKFTSAPFAVGYKLYGEDVIIMCSASDNMVVWNGVDGAYKVASSPFVTSLCVHNERMFVSVAGAKNAVWFSDDLDPTNWNPELDQGGFIELADERGKINRVVSFNNYVYIFRDYGITRLAAYGKQSDFSVNNLFVSSGRIYANTVAVCGDVIIFGAADGMYSFDGVATRKMLGNLDGLIEESLRPCACWFGGKYWAAVRLSEGEAPPAGENNGMLILDRHTGLCNIMLGANVVGVSPINSGDGEKLYLILASGQVGLAKKDGLMMGVATRKLWQSGLIDFGYPEKTKLVKEIFIDTAYDISVTVFSESAEKTFAVSGKSGISRVRVGLAGNKIGIKIVSSVAKASIARPCVSFALIK